VRNRTTNIDATSAAVCARRQEVSDYQERKSGDDRHGAPEAESDNKLALASRNRSRPDQPDGPQVVDTDVLKFSAYT
jgi:hypothetical protein